MKIKHLLVLSVSVLCVQLGLAVIGAPSADAATINVTTTTEDNANPGAGCSIYEAGQALALQTAYGGCTAPDGNNDQVVIPAGTYAMTAPVTFGATVSVLGDQAGGTIITGHGLRIYNASVRISNITIDGAVGFGIDVSRDTFGSPIIYESVLDNVTVRNGINSRGVLHTVDITRQNILRINNSNISNNGDGGVYNNECYEEINGSLYITNTNISDNTTAGRGGGIYNVCGHVVLDRVTIEGNSAGQSGGGIHSMGDARFEVTNSTIFGNTAASQGGGVYTGDPTNNSPNNLYRFLNTTIAENTAPDGSGLIMATFQPTFINSIIANNHGSAQCNVANGFAGGTVSNFASDASCSGFTNVPNLRLATSLSDNGGSALTGSGNLQGNVLTLPLLSGSPAIDAGTQSSCPSVDQRNQSRNVGSSCDSGSYEGASVNSPATSPVVAPAQASPAPVVTPPGTPKTGLKLITGNPLVAFAVASTSSISLLALTRKIGFQK